MTPRRRSDARLRSAACVLVLAAMLAACSSSSGQLMDQAETNWRKGRYEDSIQGNQALYKLEPRGRYAGRALLNIGNIYYLNLRKLKPAIEFYEKLTAEFPDSAEAILAHKQLAAIYANELVDLDQAIAQYDKLLEAKNLDGRQEILFQRADAYLKREEFDHARRELLGLEDAGVSGRLADQVSLKIGDSYAIQKRFDEAVEPYQKVLTSSFPECRRRAIISLADTYENLFEFDQAMQTLRMLDKSPENDRYLQSEVTRLSARRKGVETGGLVWDHAPVSPAAAKIPPARRRPKKKTKTELSPVI
jgi:tetratricopeptide (TPR) repeat protein